MRAQRAAVALVMTGAVLGIYGGGSENIGGRVGAFSDLSPGNPPVFVTGQGENGAGVDERSAGDLRNHARVSRSMVGGRRRDVARCQPGSWRTFASSSERWIIRRESGGRVHAWNRTATSTGHAFGLGQLTYENRVLLAVPLRVVPASTNPCDQLAMMRRYIRERYGSGVAAVAFWRAHGWY